jgi:riboflavin kinase/FMN adenylyltransferase
MMKVIYNFPLQPVDDCVATIGSFDGVHRGHLSLIQRVKELAESEKKQSAVITFSNPPLQIIRPEDTPLLLTSCEEKIERLSHTGIDECFVLDFTKELSKLSAAQFMEEIMKKQYHVSHLVIGYDNRFGYNREEGFEDYVRYGQSLGIQVENITALRKADQIISSSAIRELLLRGDMAAATTMLGYPYTLRGMVVSGHQVGRTMGFPTANLQLCDTGKLVPAKGVYAVWVTVDGKVYKGMLNIGQRPTVHNGDECSIEVHILNFHSNIYQRQLSVSFIQRIRSEYPFESIEALEAQLKKDQEQVKRLLTKKSL